MSDRRGYTKLWRSICDSDVYTLPPVTKLLAYHLIVTVNWLGSFGVPRGARRTAAKELATELGVSPQSIRRSLRALEKCEFVRVTRAQYGILVSVVKFETWQGRQSDQFGRQSDQFGRQSDQFGRQSDHQSDTSDHSDDRVSLYGEERRRDPDPREQKEALERPPDDDKIGRVWALAEHWSVVGRAAVSPEEWRGQVASSQTAVAECLRDPAIASLSDEQIKHAIAMLVAQGEARRDAGTHDPWKWLRLAWSPKVLRSAEQIPNADVARSSVTPSATPAPGSGRKYTPTRRTLKERGLNTFDR